MSSRAFIDIFGLSVLVFLEEQADLKILIPRHLVHADVVNLLQIMPFPMFYNYFYG